MEQEKNKILIFALELFRQEGFYKTTMDDLARQLKMSKKTIYKYFPKKENLIWETSFYFVEKHQVRIKEILESEENAIQKLFDLIEYIGRMLMNVNRKWFEDIQIHQPELWKKIDEFRINIIRSRITKLIEQGKNEGYIENFSTDIIVTMFLSSVQNIVNPTFIINSKLNMNEVLESVITILMQGIMTSKGKKIFIKLKKRS